MHPSRLEGAALPLAALKEEINLKLTISCNFYTFENSPTFPHWKVKLRIWNFYLRLVCQNPIPRDSRRQIEFTECILDAKRVFLLTQGRSMTTLVEVWLRFRSLILVNILRLKSGRNFEGEVWPYPEAVIAIMLWHVTLKRGLSPWACCAFVNDYFLPSSRPIPRLSLH